MKNPTKQRTDVLQASSDESFVDKQSPSPVGVHTPKKHSGLMPNWEKGKSGNPAGRPKGARSKLADSFLHDLAQHWSKNGKTALEAAYKKNPVEYVRVVASLLPKNVAVDVDVKFERIERVIVPAKTIEHEPLPAIEAQDTDS
jgi:hypothetical protein